MKKNLIQVAIVFLAILAGLNRVTAQGPTSENKLAYLENDRGSKTIFSLARPAGEMDPVSPRALKDFAKTYKNITNESWERTADGFSARFTLNSVKTTIFYDNKGRWTGSIKQFKEEKMPSEIRHMVKRAYYDYNIVYMQEVETVDSHKSPTYIICIEDKLNVKLVRVWKGEMELWKDLQKFN